MHKVHLKEVICFVQFHFYQLQLSIAAWGAIPQRHIDLRFHRLKKLL